MSTLSSSIALLTGSNAGRRTVAASIDRPVNAALFQNSYVWLVFLSAMDCIMTWMVLHAGGEEVNGIANAILQRFDMMGMVIYKFILISFVIICCEVIGRQRPRTAWRLIAFAVIASGVPVTAAFAQLLMYSPF